jgi:superfamily I DNA and/or RNA helicase
VREAWARTHRVELGSAVRRALHAARATRSLKSVLGSGRNAAAWLRQLLPAWGSTLLSLGNLLPPEPGCIDLAVIDEAAQCHPAYAVAALLRARRCLVIGDVCQLEPVVELEADDEARVVQAPDLAGRLVDLEPYRAHAEAHASAQSLADRAVERRLTLIDHFRCQPEIAAISDALCDYGLVVHTARQTRADRAPWLTAPVLHVPVQGSQQRFAGSWMNVAEVEVAVHLVSALIDCGIAASDIGVVTPYRGQLERLWHGLRQARVFIERPAEQDESAEAPPARSRPGLALGTVHRFQGGERSIIVLSTTLTRRESLPFVDARKNLVNVAVSRARDHLIVLGHTPTLEAGQHTRHLVAKAVALDAGAVE